MKTSAGPRLENFASHTHELRQGAFSNAKEYAQIFVRTAFLLNGGSILALLTFIGPIYGKGDQSIILVVINFSKSVYPAFLAYVAGLVSIATTAAIAYFN